MTNIFLGGATAALALIAGAASAQATGSVGAAVGAPGGAAVSLEAGANVQASPADPTALEAGSNLKRATRKSRRDTTGPATAGSASVNGEANAGNRTPDGR